MKQAAKSPTSPSGAASKTPVALGFRAHSGWAALVAVAGSPRPACPPIEPLVIDRRRIELARAGVPVQPYPGHEQPAGARGRRRARDAAPPARAAHADYTGIQRRGERGYR